MKVFIRILLLFSAVMVTCCSYEVNENKELSDKLVGEWRNVSMKIEMKSYKNSDSSRTLEVNESNWEQKMHIRPIRTFFKANRTYNSQHISLNDSVIYNPAGKWVIVGDTLHMWDTFPKAGLMYKYKVEVHGNLAEFYGVEDCDGDGNADDLYYGSQRKQ